MTVRSISRSVCRWTRRSYTARSVSAQLQELFVPAHDASANKNDIADRPVSIEGRQIRLRRWQLRRGAKVFPRLQFGEQPLATPAARIRATQPTLTRERL